MIPIASGASDTAEVDLLKALTGQATTIFTTTPLAHVYVGLFTTNWATAHGSNTEVTGGSYARVDSVGSWAAPSGSGPASVASNAAVTFPTSSAAWSASAAIKSFGIFTALTAGTLLYGGDLTDQTKTVTGASDVVSFASGALTVTLA